MPLFGLAKSREEKELKKKEGKKQEELEKQIVEALKRIIVFPGSKAEFEDFIGYKTAWVDFGGPRKGVIYYRDDDNPFCLYSKEFQKRLVDLHVLALVNVMYFRIPGPGVAHTDCYYGMPVKKAAEGSLIYRVS